jgi:membrane-bound ClpP family serine protease
MFASLWRGRWGCMIILGIILLVVGLLVSKLAVLVTIGIVLIVIGLILAIVGHTGHAFYGRRHWF